MLQRIIMGIGSGLLAVSSLLAQSSPPLVTHQVLQAVDDFGYSTFSGPEVIRLEGIILNSPEEILDPEPNASPFMGGQWQLYLQGQGDDHGGTAVWMGQKYGNLPFVPPDGSYSDEAWLAELCRINHDPNTGYLFHPGDRVQVTGRYLYYNGKININEQHDIASANDFVITLLEPAAGLPAPEVLTLAELKDGDDQFIFTAPGGAGCEPRQGRRLRINNVSLLDPAAWGPGQTIHIGDRTGRTFPVLLGIGQGIQSGNCNLEATFDVIGILDQEDNSAPYTGGYRLWVPNYDGNGLALTARGHRRGNLAGDIQADGRVDLRDLAALARQWLRAAPGIAGCP
ncbi:MAG: hypothetical protein JW810_04035 [Sedimentisphaerales bacterium]|nr:hypothetical protein [Sedimentisphaerales bacterium]